ncbi:MAG: 4-hydroxy-tetrahydrodipicolinate synthase [Clostridium sp.]|nr:4-hydroxy-tetrahydrodipicolinate synthase [Clostridium sp.]MCM1400039.1 4-hydroxy-tetrahydrodipicolinate synthase [Clostridium sp.]MCM1459811.1 4-hydroxy-tetrahydrodipicolinate synthase [Bacteroides sp.]
MAIFTGAGVAITTPFHEDGSVDYESFRKHIEYQIEMGTDSIIVCGTTGEASTLTHEEHLECIKFCVSVVNKRVPVVAGTGSNCTDTAIYLSKEAQKLGADALLVVTPYYNKATQKGLIAHFTAIAESVSLPIILYNVPSRTGVNILPETAVTLAKTVENIVAIKEASGNISQVVKLAALADGCIDIYSGNDDQVIPILSLGGKGVISVLSNVAPKETHDMVVKYLEGDVKGALDIQLKAIPLCDALFCEVNPIPVKKAVSLIGYGNGRLRMPLSDIEEANEAKLVKAMKDFGINLTSEP